MFPWQRPNKLEKVQRKAFKMMRKWREEVNISRQTAKIKVLQFGTREDWSLYNHGIKGLFSKFQNTSLKENPWSLRENESDFGSYKNYINFPYNSIFNAKNPLVQGSLAW